MEKLLLRHMQIVGPGPLNILQIRPNFMQSGSMEKLLPRHVRITYVWGHFKLCVGGGHIKGLNLP